jgi:hypothetical protein
VNWYKPSQPILNFMDLIFQWSSIYSPPKEMAAWISVISVLIDEDYPPLFGRKKYLQQREASRMSAYATFFQLLNNVNPLTNQSLEARLSPIVGVQPDPAIGSVVLHNYLFDAGYHPRPVSNETLQFASIALGYFPTLSTRVAPSPASIPRPIQERSLDHAEEDLEDWQPLPVYQFQQGFDLENQQSPGQFQTAINTGFNHGLQVGNRLAKGILSTVANAGPPKNFRCGTCHRTQNHSRPPPRTPVCCGRAMHRQ